MLPAKVWNFRAPEICFDFSDFLVGEKSENREKVKKSVKKLSGLSL